MKPSDFDRIMVMCPKGTPAQPDDDGNMPPPAFTKCALCGIELVYDARNKARIDSEKITALCADCAADVVLSSGRGAVVQGMLDGKASNRGVNEFLDTLADRESIHRRPN